MDPKLDKIFESKREFRKKLAKQPIAEKLRLVEELAERALATRKDTSAPLPDRPWPTDDPCDEIRGLAETAGAKVVAELTQKRQDIHLATYIGSGKVKELAELVEATDADVAIFDNDLSPAQARNLEKALGVKVVDGVDKTGFIKAASPIQDQLAKELGQGLLELLVEVQGAVQEPASRASGTVPAQGPACGLENLRMMRQAQIVVRAEHDPLLTVDDDDGVFRFRDRIEVRIQPKRLNLARLGEVPALVEQRDLLKLLSIHGTSA